MEAPQLSEYRTDPNARILGGYKMTQRYQALGNLFVRLVTRVKSAEPVECA